MYVCFDLMGGHYMYVIYHLALKLTFIWTVIVHLFVQCRNMWMMLEYYFLWSPFGNSSTVERLLSSKAIWEPLHCFLLYLKAIWKLLHCWNITLFTTAYIGTPNCWNVLFSSPDPKGYVSYSHHLASVVRRKFFKNLLLWKY